MRIGFVADVYKPQISGVTNYILANKRELEKLGHEVFVFAYGPREYDFGEENVIITPGVAFKKTYYVGLGFNRRARDLLASMDIAHLQHPFLSGKQALNICKPKGIPLVFTNHTRYDLYIQYYVSWMPKGLWMAYLRSYLPGFYRQMDLVIAPSPGLREVSAQWGIDVAMEVIPNGIELELFTTNQERRERGELGFSAQDVILVFAGRVVAEKNLRFLLEAFRRVAARYPQAALLILGDGAERKPLLRLVGAPAGDDPICPPSGISAPGGCICHQFQDGSASPDPDRSHGQRPAVAGGRITGSERHYPGWDQWVPFPGRYGSLHGTDDAPGV
jgi:1,2-diacylglycerol 3-alpha-glucosyltransferase